MMYEKDLNVAASADVKSKLSRHENEIAKYEHVQIYIWYSSNDNLVLKKAYGKPISNTNLL